jgi:hypothetical protein
MVRPQEAQWQPHDVSLKGIGDAQLWSLDKGRHRVVMAGRSWTEQRQVRLLGDPRQQPRALALEPQLSPPAHLFGCRAAARAPALRPLHDTGDAHPK